MGKRTGVKKTKKTPAVRHRPEACQTIGCPVCRRHEIVTTGTGAADDPLVISLP